MLRLSYVLVMGPLALEQVEFTGLQVAGLKVGVARRACAYQSSALSPAENTFVSAKRFGDARRAEWIAGRTLARQILASHGITGGSILANRDGRPRWIHPSHEIELSLSHDGEFVGLAWGTRAGPVGVDVCLRSHRKSLSRIFSRFRISHDCDDVVLAWAALECALKIQGLGVGDVLKSFVGIKRAGSRAVVELYGQATEVQLFSDDRFALAWGPIL